MKNFNYKALTISTMAIAVLAFALVLLHQSGILNRDPKVSAPEESPGAATLHVITDRDYSPYSFYDADGNLSGYDIELVTMVAQKLHMNLDIRMLEWQEAIRAMNAGEADILMTCDYSDSFTGVDRIGKSTPTSNDIFAVYSKHKIKSASQMFGKRIAIMEEGNVTPQLEQIGLLQYCDNYKDNRQVMEALIDGSADFAVMRQTVGTTLLDELGARGIKAYLSIGQSYMCWGVSGADPQLEAKIDAALDELNQSGSLDKLAEKWLTTFVRPYTIGELISRNLWIIVFFLILVAICTIVILKLKQREFDDRTRHELEYQQALEETNKSKTDFLFNMSHDIRTPMNAIIGFTGIAKNSIEDRERVLDCLDKIEKSGSHLLELINEVLDMSRIESGKIRSEMKVVNIAEEAAGLVYVCQESAIQRGVSLSFEDLGITHETVKADELHINQIILNVLGNAIKYTPAGGSVRYTAQETESAIPGYGKYVFTVKDTGVGMSEEFLEHIFDSFSREDNVMTSEIQGTGLGMAIVKRLVDYLDGKIDIRSEKGKGTEVAVTLHLKMAEEAAISSDKSGDAPLVNLDCRRILLVEDNELNREIATVILEEKGAIVETAENGIDAVQHVKDNGPAYYDVILMDIQMPMMNGYEATAAIRELPGTAGLPIIALSANAFEEDRNKSISYGMNDHVAKPIDIDKLLETLAKYL